jgi:2'-5' RNA ligase
VSSAVVVPVPEAEPLVARWRKTWVPPAPRGVTAHVTVLFPFLRAGRIDDDALSRLREAAAGVEPFAFELAEVGRFPQTVYLVPVPAAPFSLLIRRAWERFPERPPYAGRHPEIVPHLTVTTSPDEDTLARAAADAAAWLPISSRAAALLLLEEDEHGGYRPRAEIPLGA